MSYRRFTDDEMEGYLHAAGVFPREDFRAWLAAHDAEVKSEAWDEGAVATIRSPEDPHADVDWLGENNPYREA